MLEECIYSKCLLVKKHSELQFYPDEAGYFSNDENNLSLAKNLNN